MLTVADIMTPHVTTIASGATVADAIDLMQRRQIRALLVEHRSQEMPFGMVTERDIVYTVVARGHSPEKVLVQDIMRQPCISLAPDLTIQEASQVLSDTGVQRAPVVRDGELLGVISVTDILMRGMPAIALSR
ncbi:CBS domain-containing protein [Nodosilinea sp. PGN35]|uniref:CBS domain-containing protein n=1 Tax=Nodosilinea sp. PGN35 TaxID=3020489 RepID=UPI0023B28100|nr:CBS domain-containing protein [Nodosilinea sp. TSF1-S3]MDF0366637.1 CBS domain-containing protein [Nodosilinea sp. TSF1-S3]